MMVMTMSKAMPTMAAKPGEFYGRTTPKTRTFLLGGTLFEVDSKYVPVKAIGKGSYGVVCSSINVETKEKVAIKKIGSVFDNRIEALRALREIIILRNLGHQNVIGLKDVMISSPKSSFQNVYLVYELMDTDLSHIIKSPQPLSDEHCKYFLFQLLQGLNYLHTANILHRDLKPGNLLVNSNFDLKICDFGLARTINEEQGHFMTEYVVTRWYRAPELLLGCYDYGTSIDVWSVGCIFAELLGRKPLFPGTDSLNQLKLILQVLGTQQNTNLDFVNNVRGRNYIKSLCYRGTQFGYLFPYADPLAIDLLQKLLVFDPTKRITVKEALQHPYMSTLYEEPCHKPVFPFSMDLDIAENSGTPVLREFIWREMLLYHPATPAC